MKSKTFSTWAAGRELARYILKQATLRTDVPVDIVKAAKHVQWLADDEDADKC